MKTFRILLAILLLVVPVVARTLWFYNGIPSRLEVKTPDYLSLEVPKPPASTIETWPVKPTEGKIVVVDYYHSNQFQPGEIEALVTALTARGARIEMVEDGSLATRLKYASAYVVISPTYSFTTDELLLVQRFVERGGRLLVLTDATRGTLDWDYFSRMPIVTPDVNAANTLLAPFDIVFANDYLYNLVENEGNFRNVLFKNFAAVPLTRKLGQVALYGAHSVSTASGTALLIGDENTFSSLTDAGGELAAAALSANGQVLALGDFTFLMPPYNQVADNAPFVDRLVDFLLGDERVYDLADFPYLFNQPVSLLPTGEVQLTAELLSPIAGLQSTLKLVNIDLQVVEKAPKISNLIVLGTYTPSEDLIPYLAPFELGLEEGNDYITVPGFGKVGRTGTGLMLFASGKTGNILVLLTDAIDDLSLLVDVLSYGNLSACVIQGQIGVCSIGSSDSFYEDFYFEEPTE